MENPFDPGYYGSEELRSFGFARIGENVRIAKNCKIVGLSNISFADNVRIDDFCTIIANGPLSIGSRVHIHSYCQIGTRGGVIIEDFVSIASNCLIFSASDDPVGRGMVGGMVPVELAKSKVAPVVFQKHSGLFARCTVLPGVTLEEGAMACAHSLVSRSVPKWTIAAGSPAINRVPRPRNVLALEAVIAVADKVAA